MILIPQRLFDAPQVETIMRDENVCILKKTLNESIVEREGYISNHVIVILLAGQQMIRTYDDQTIQVKAGQVLFIPRGMYYITDLIPDQGRFESLLFYFDDDVIQEFLSTTQVTEIKKTSSPDYLKFEMVPSIRLFADSLLLIYQAQQLNHKRLLSLKILELLLLLNKMGSQQVFADYLFRLSLPKKRNIKSFMENNFDKPLKIEDYAYLTGRSETTFRRDFKSYFDCTPQQWIKESRLKKAIRVIEKDQSISVSELAYRVGYEHVSYFIKSFKVYTGKSPKQYILEKNKLQ